MKKKNQDDEFTWFFYALELEVQRLSDKHSPNDQLMSFITS
jgi:hypothetical protein